MYILGKGGGHAFLLELVASLLLPSPPSFCIPLFSGPSSHSLFSFPPSNFFSLLLLLLLFLPPLSSPRTRVCAADNTRVQRRNCCSLSPSLSFTYFRLPYRPPPEVRLCVCVVKWVRGKKSVSVGKRAYETNAASMMCSERERYRRGRNASATSGFTTCMPRSCCHRSARNEGEGARTCNVGVPRQLQRRSGCDRCQGISQNTRTHRENSRNRPP